ncbi:MAG: biosynthetic-type acetolactate synthase large subunit [Deltaproteobacteria bacterium]|uniref:Acetolactate synthase n=1 Tax=Candidatus Zymogenus saltonus TaxID=2844893 RepID=A0A9D8KBE8_9DELT|nr:biosynthetic-type acetolactate synthase large subunit [Candidatus Zymogenus saltonus]
MTLTGTEIFFKTLLDEGVDTIFGYPGGAVLNLYHGMPDYDIRHILVRHEQAAVHAADGYARASGRVGVVLVTSGPGATNTVTGIATAHMDSIPIVVFTGQVPSMLIGNDAFQEADIVGITRPCTKHNYLVKQATDLEGVIREAFHIAKTGRPGPVLVDLPRDVMTDESDYNGKGKLNLKGYTVKDTADVKRVEEAYNAILSAKKPLFYIGGGVISSSAAKELKELAEMLTIPVTSSLMGLGGFPGTHPLFLGMLGMHGTYRANMAVTNSDLLIAVGSRFDDRVTGKVDEFAPKAKIVHIDIDPTSISKNIIVDIPIISDVKVALKSLIKIAAKGKRIMKADRKEWLSQIEKWKSTHPLNYEQKMESGIIKPQFVVESIYRVTKGDAIIATEVGQNQMWTAQFFNFDRPRTLLTSGGLGTMGYGFPAAIGAQVAFPEKLVFDIAGDGSIQMNIQEIATAVQHNLPVKVAIINNGFLGMVRQWQELFFEERYSHTTMDFAPDFVKLAEAYGAVGIKVEDPKEVEGAVEEAISIKRPVIIDFRVDKEENVYPMVPVGSPIDKMLLV